MFSLPQNVVFRGAYDLGFQMHYYEQRTTNYQLYSTNVECSLQIHPFLKNKANFQKSQVDVNRVLTREYEQMDTWSIGKNKAKTKPIQSQYKPNTNPIRTQYKAKQTQSVVSLSNLFQALPCKNGAHELKYVDRLAQLTLNLKIRKGLFSI